MSKLHLSQLIPFITDQPQREGIYGLLRDILVLEDQLSRTDEQDFYAQKGRPNRLRHLEHVWDFPAWPKTALFSAFSPFFQSCSPATLLQKR